MAATLCFWTVLCLYQIYFVTADVHEGLFLSWQANISDPAFFPVNKTSSQVKISIKFMKRWESLVNPCKGVASPNVCASSSAVPLHVYFGSSAASQGNFFKFLTVQFSCPAYPYENATVQGYSEAVLVMERRYFYKMSYSSCCWSPSLVQFPSSSLNQQSIISFGLTRRNSLNSPVQLQHFPRMVFPHDRTTTVYLPVYDPENDTIFCRWAESYDEGGGIYKARMGNLVQRNCSLTVDGASYSPGVYALVFMLEDFDSASLSKRHHSVSLQLNVYIEGPAQNQKPMVNCNHKSHVPLRLPPLVSNDLPLFPSPTMRPYANIDGCSSYQNLSSHDRAIDYHDWSSFRCDMLLYGWYRFTGKSGSNMLSSCPASSSAAASCGTLYKGWLKDQSWPSIGEGVVNRTACFSMPGSCKCALSRSIKIKNCGGFFVYYFDAVPRCNARYCGKTDLGATVHCSSNYIKIELDENRYKRDAYSSITLRSPKCMAVGSSAKISLGTTFSDCNTTRRTAGDHLIYENQLTLKPKSSGIISRDSDVHIAFSCLFPTDAFLSFGGQKVMQEVNASEPGFGQFKLSLHMYINGQYKQKHTDFPVFVRLQDRLHFEASTSASDSYIILLDSCYSTYNPSVAGSKKDYFVNERCGIGNGVQFHKAVKAEQRFSINASQIFGNDSSSYVHCLVFLCHVSSQDNRCQAGCQGNNLKRTSRSVRSPMTIFRPSTVSKYYLVGVGAIKKEKDQSNGHKVISDTALCLLLILVTNIIVAFLK